MCVLVSAAVPALQGSVAALPPEPIPGVQEAGGTRYVPQSGTVRAI